MTKLEIVSYILEADLLSLDNRLETLMNQGRITSGARYYVYNPYHIYSLKIIQELVDKASSSKNYIRYIKRIESTKFEVWLQMFKEDLKRITDYIEEQENLPFNETDKQVLIQNEELK